MTEQTEKTGVLRRNIPIERLAEMAEEEHGDFAELYAREHAKAAAQIGSDQASMEWREVERELHEEEE